MMTKLFVALSMVALHLLVHASDVRAEAPPSIPIQGFLADAAGAPVSGAVKIRFRLYDAATAGTILFEEIMPKVQLDAGYFTAYLGAGRTIDLNIFREHPLVYVGVLVEADKEELSPRLQLATAPYAAFAQSCGDASTVGGLTVDELRVQGPEGQQGPAGATGAMGVLKVETSGPVSASLTNQTLTIGMSPLSCSPGYLIRSIGDSGAVTCEPGVSRGTVEDYAREVCYDSEAELRAALDDNYLSSAGGIVSGAVTATRYALSSARSEYVTLPGLVFNDANTEASMTQHTTTGKYYFGPNSALDAHVYAVASVSVPDGAIITEASCSFTRGSTNEVAFFQLSRTNGNGTSTDIGAPRVFTSGTGAIGTSVPLTVSGLSETVSLPSRSYFITVKLTNSAAGDSYQRLALNQCYVKYTRAEL